MDSVSMEKMLSGSGPKITDEFTRPGVNDFITVLATFMYASGSRSRGGRKATTLDSVEGWWNARTFIRGRFFYFIHEYLPANIDRLFREI
jgi:hypothetical protein